MSKKVFISYSRDPSEYEEHARQYCSGLEDRKISTWIATRDIRGGEHFGAAIIRAIDSCALMVVLLTERANASPYVRNEVNRAFAQKKPILPVFLADVQPSPELALPLQGTQRINAWALTPEEVLDQSEAAIRAALPLWPNHDTTTARKRALIFDVDGTILSESESLQNQDKAEVLDLLERLILKGFRLVFITGNDYRKQFPRILEPLMRRGLADSTLCFTDGGSRAFEFHAAERRFIEIDEYSNQNLVDKQDARHICDEFELEFKEFFRRHETLRIPDVLPYARTLDYLEYVIRPIRPSFYRSSAFERFCADILACCHRPLFMTTTFELIKSISYALVIRAHGKAPQVDNDLTRLASIIFGDLLLRQDYTDISKPEVEVRGGDVVSQIAIKPFKDDQLRLEFREIMDRRLNGPNRAQFGVLIGGRTTIDVQRLDVNKAKAIRFAMQRMDLNPSTAVYFGDEFVPFGNDLPVALMADSERPGLMVHVGQTDHTPEEVRSHLLLDGNGPKGTMNYLRLLDFETSRSKDRTFTAVG